MTYEFKNTSYEHIGPLPSHWSVRSLGRAFGLVGSGTTPRSDVEKYYDGGTIAWVNTGDLNDDVLLGSARKVTDEALQDHSSLRTYPVGSVVIAMYGATIGKLSILGCEAAVNQACCVFAGGFTMLPKYAFFSLQAFRRHIVNLAYGGGQPNISQETLRALRVPVPPLNEQTAIAAFLERETAKIDALVEEQRRLIELLKEKRQAVISHAVTKGLDPNVRMKPSGVEWLGDVPEHWELQKFSRCISIAEGQVNPEVEPYRSMPLIAPNHVESATGRLLYLESASDQGAESGKYLCSEGDVIYSKIRPALAKVVIAPTESLCSADMYPLRALGGLTQSYLRWLLLSVQYTAWAVLEADRVAMPKVNRETLSHLRLPVPPSQEQERICVILDEETRRIDSLIFEAEMGIQLLNERRSALISAAVTGKIDVRDLVACGEAA